MSIFEENIITTESLINIEFNIYASGINIIAAKELGYTYINTEDDLRFCNKFWIIIFKDRKLYIADLGWVKIDQVPNAEPIFVDKSMVFQDDKYYVYKTINNIDDISIINHIINKLENKTLSSEEFNEFIGYKHY